MRVVTMTLVAAMLAAVGVSASAGTDFVAQFELFKKTHHRTYVTPSEEAKRLGFFIRNMQRAQKLQATNPMARFGMNEFSDMSEEEFKTRHNAEGHFRAAVKSRKAKKAEKATGTFAQSIDWRTKGVVTGVKNQGQCGSCWSFSTTGNIEGQWAKAGHSLVSLSEQELVSCDTTCNGCNGGLMDLAFEWLVNARGGAITSEAQYPYVSGGGVAPGCDMSGKTAAAFISGHHDVAHSESAMAQWMSTGGPLSIGVDASSWQTYSGGVLTDCTSSQVDHGVLAVGYDLTHNPPYWIIKNSWGASWGESGYIRVAYGSNQCLITTAPSSSIVSGNAPPVPPPGPPAPSGSSSGSSSSSGNGPSPPAPPSSGTFTQSICPYIMCLSGCSTNTFQTGVCLQLQGGGSVVASCGTSNLHLNVYTSSDCSGSATPQEQPLNSCVQDTAGTYLYNQCSDASAKNVMMNRANVTIAKRH